MAKILFSYKKVLILLVLASLVLTSMAGIGSANGSQTGLSNNVSSSLIPVQGNINPVGAGNSQQVNVYELYQAQPAPMGIADYGINQNDQPYTYETSSFMGVVQISYLSTYNSSQNSPLMTIQLNVNMRFYDGHYNRLFVYWIQDVALLNTSNGQVLFIDNIWNSSSALGSMYNSTVLGNGTVASSQQSPGFYYDVANATLPGNNVTLPSSTFKLSVYTYQNSNGFPEVDFLYNDGYGWITYDNAEFIFATYLRTYPYFIVDGYSYEPNGYSFYDAELIMGGPGGGSQTENLGSDVNLSLQYYNGNNFQAISNAFNFGSDTAEGIFNVFDSGYYEIANGQPFANVVNGYGTLGMIYHSSQFSSLAIATNVENGQLLIGGAPVANFTGGFVNVTIYPGTYAVSIYDYQTGLTAYLGTYSLEAGIYYSLNGYVYPVEFIKTGLPAGTEWYLNVSGLGSTGPISSDYYYMELPNGTYSYSISSGTKTYFPSPASGTFTVNGFSVTETITFYKKVYSMSFTELGLPQGDIWYVNLTGNFNSGPISTNTFTFDNLTNGTYTFHVSTGDSKYSPSPFTGNFTINGGSGSEAIAFSLVSYSVEFTQHGLPAGTSWQVTLNGSVLTSTTPSIIFTEPNGSYYYSVMEENGFVLHSSFGSVTVDGSNVVKSVNFSKLYSVTFSEIGLPEGISWSLTFNGTFASSSNASMSFIALNGSYQYDIQSIQGYKTDNYHGTVTVDGSSLSETVSWSIIKYPITVLQTGIENGTLWSATLSGEQFNGQLVNTTLNSTSGSITFSEPNGSYTYSIHLPGGYKVKSGSSLTGLTSVAGVQKTVPVSVQKVSSNGTTLTVLAIVAALVIIGFVFVTRRRR